MRQNFAGIYGNMSKCSNDVCGQMEKKMILWF